MFWVISLWSQNKEVLYGLEETPQAMLLNPGSRISYKYHFGIPFLSHLHVNGGSSGVTVYDIFQESSSVNINTRIRNKIYELDNNDFFTATQQLEVLNFGWKNKKDYYFSGGVYQELDFVLYFPKDLAILAWEGNATNIDKEFDLGEVNTVADLLMVYHLGVNKRINEKFTLGARAKIYSSMLSLRSTKNSGTFVTRLSESGNNIYEHTVNNANMSVNTSGLASLSDLEGSQLTSKIIGRAFFGGNLGLGIDLGATYEINEKWTASASILDLGAIFHKKDVETYNVSGEYTLDGIELLFPPLGDGEAAPPYYDDLIEDIEDTFPVDTLYNSYTQMRPVKMYASLKYNFGKAIGGDEACNCLKMGENQQYDQSVGFQYFNTFRPKGPQIAATLFYYRRISDYFTVKASYTADSYSYSNIGLGLVTTIKMVNFYIVADNLQWYGNIAKAKSVSLQLGFNIIIDKNE
jgi:hypothetical protein